MQRPRNVKITQCNKVKIKGRHILIKNDKKKLNEILLMPPCLRSLPFRQCHHLRTRLSPVAFRTIFGEFSAARQAGQLARQGGRDSRVGQVSTRIFLISRGIISTSLENGVSKEGGPALCLASVSLR